MDTRAPRGWPKRAAGIVLAIAAAVLPRSVSAASTGRSIRLEVLGAPTCPSGEQVASALERHFGAGSVLVGAPVAGAPSIRLRALGGGAVEIALVEGGGVAARRTLSNRDGSCALLAATAALLVDAWLIELPWREAHERAPGSSSRAASGSSAREARADEPMALPPPPAPARPTLKVPAAPTVPVPATAAPVTATAPATATVTVPAPAPPLRSQSLAVSALSTHSLHALLEVGGAAGAAPDARASYYGGTAAAELGLGNRVGFGAAALLASPVRAAALGGTVSADRMELEVYARYGLHAPERAGFDLLAGLAIDRVAAESFGFSQTFARTFFDPAVAAAVQARQPIGRHWLLFAAAGATVPLHREELDVAPVGAVLTIPPVWLTVSAGLGARWP